MAAPRASAAMVWEITAVRTGLNFSLISFCACAPRVKAIRERGRIILFIQNNVKIQKNEGDKIRVHLMTKSTIDSLSPIKYWIMR